MKNILVSIDFDKKPELLIDKALELAVAFDSKIWLMHIAAPDPDFGGFEIGPQNVRDNRAAELRKEHKLIQDYAVGLKEKGTNADGLLIQGATIETILEEAKKLDVDMIIAGHHQHGLLYKAFIGSVSGELIKKSKIPVLIIPY